MPNFPLNRTVIGTILFIDIVAFSQTAVSQQWAMKSALNRAIEGALSKVAEADRIMLDTGDGAAICFLGDPEEALFVANDIRGKTMQLTGEEAHELRVGINLGPIRIVKDVTGRTNVIGDGINVAQRVMSFAEAGEILVSRSYYEVVARLREGNEQMFRGLGVRTDKHVREHQLYSLLLPGAAGATDAAPKRSAADVAPKPATAAPAPASATLESARDMPATSEEKPALAVDSAVLADLGARLAQHIGPLAPVIVSRALRGNSDLRAFLAAIAAPIADANDRQAFLAAASALISDASGHEAAASAVGEPPAAAPATPSKAAEPIAADLVTVAARELADQLGPIAAVLAKKAAAETHDRHHFLQLLAARLPDEPSRQRFLAAVERKASAIG